MRPVQREAVLLREQKSIHMGSEALHQCGPRPDVTIYTAAWKFCFSSVNACSTQGKGTMPHTKNPATPPPDYDSTPVMPKAGNHTDLIPHQLADLFNPQFVHTADTATPDCTMEEDCVFSDTFPNWSKDLLACVSHSSNLNVRCARLTSMVSACSRSAPDGSKIKEMVGEELTFHWN